MDGVINASELPMLYSYQALTYCYAAIAFLFLYDYSLMFSDELLFLRESKRGATKALFITARYSPFVVFVVRVYMDSVSDPDINKCHSFDLVVRVFTLFAIECSEGLFIIRAYALWRKSKRILALILVTFLTSIIIAVAVALTSGGGVTCLYLHFVAVCKLSDFSANQLELVSKPPVSTFTGCYLVSQGHLLYIAFIVLIVFELELVILVGIQVFKSYRESGSRLLKILVRQSAIYYACGLFWSAVNIFTLLLLKDDYNSSLEYFQIGVHTILATRMHMSLWKADRRDEIVETPSIAISTIQFAGGA
ncbi:hypothetical protein DEU56DRAFT_908804 [Suillus clintonianus]|uniref:uncharacterized protein n=1 Tax=Suillus clintonianus TaxID=1904413 RepID=UPI001B872A1A|nr:uncharacterized protein DEU56DRAFT_908804 [Suillus clintonianus]KAG2150571.1 hypothetical protein DEU56DRAFT_908804 [Suillus clintonianus]